MSTWASRCQRICAHWSHEQSVLNRLEDKQACLSWHTILQPPHGSVLIKNTSWFGCVTGPQALRARAAAEPEDRVEVSECVCACACVHARTQRWAYRREKNLWKQSHDSWGGSMCEACLFCIYPLWCSCVHCPFPRTQEHSRRPHGPPSSPWAAAQGPLCPYLLGMFHFQIFCCLDLLELGWGV